MARLNIFDKARCMTSSVDGTVRLWDVNTADKQQVTVIKTKNAKGQRTTPTAACYAPNGDIIAACDDGTIKLFDGKAVARGSTQRAHGEAKTAHQPGTEVTCVCVSQDGNTLLSRGGDDTLKVWDLRKLGGAPLRVYENLMNAFDTTECTPPPLVLI